MKPSKIRNRTIYNASLFTKSKMMCSHLSEELQQKYNKTSVRVTEGDTVRVMRGEYKGVSGKVTRVSTERNGISIEGIKKEKTKGGNLDVFIHTSNVLVTDLNTGDKWRQNKLEGKNPKPAKEQPKEQPKPQPKPEPMEIKKQTKEEKEKPKETKKPEPKQETKKETKKESKPKTVKQAKKEDK